MDVVSQDLKDQRSDKRLTGLFGSVLMLSGLVLRPRSTVYSRLCLIKSVKVSTLAHLLNRVYFLIANGSVLGRVTMRSDVTGTIFAKTS